MRPIWAFHAQTSIRTSGRSAQPGFAFSEARLAFDDPDAGAELAAGRSAFGGTTDPFTWAGGASVFTRLEPDLCHSLQPPMAAPMTRISKTIFPNGVKRIAHASPTGVNTPGRSSPQRHQRGPS